MNATFQMINPEVRTYATFDNAVVGLTRACAKVGVDPTTLRWLVASMPQTGGLMRFAPVVMYDRNRNELIQLAHHGVSVVG